LRDIGASLALKGDENMLFGDFTMDVSPRVFEAANT
jgi:hypothetical protein